MAALFSPGQQVAGRYRIERELGRGGMAVVFLARDEAHARQVAVKVLAPELGGLPASERFLAEIRTTAGLSHPHILPLIDSGDEGGLLYYVTPLVRGESLRDRLKRDGPLPLDEALRLGVALAGALAHAHAEGIIHRDVKPANVLLDPAGNPYLADFGIARALAPAEGELRTTTGQLIGTVQYMSPEQLSGADDIDGRADVYALGCVLHEMLTGAPPYRGSSAEAIIAAHLMEPPPSLAEQRSDLPAELDEIVRASLAKERDHRLASADDLGRALEEIRVATRAGRPGRVRLRTGAGPGPGTRVAYAVGAVLALAAFAIAVRSGLPGPGGPASDLDTTRYAVRPFEVDSTLSDMVPIDLLLQDALAAWEGITVVDGLQIRDQLARVGSGPPITMEQAQSVAEALAAGRLVAGAVRSVRDSARVEALLLDATRDGERLARVVFMVPRDGASIDVSARRAAESLLFGSEAAGVDARAIVTTSAPARRQFGLGQAALLEWNLLEAERRFAQAAETDPNFAQAALWKAQVTSWLGRPTREWAADARRAADGIERLGERERLLAAGLAAMADGEFPDACAAYDALRERDGRDFAAWYGLGECHGRDPLVLPDSTSRTGWSFRGSGHAAASAYRVALESLPSSYRAFGAGGLDLVRSKLYAAEGPNRTGRGPPPNTPAFYGFREWHADSLAFVAVPVSELTSFVPDLDAWSEALTHQRRALLDVATAWVRAFPESADAVYTLAAARELVGDPTALDMYVRARTLAESPRVRTMAAGAETLLRVRRALPHEPQQLEAAVALADSVLASASPTDPRGSEVLGQLAVLLGRPNRAASYARTEEGGSPLAGSPPEVGREADALLIFAAVGGPVDSIRALESRSEERIRQTIRPAEVTEARHLLLGQPALLAFPIHVFAYLTDSVVPRSPEGRAIAALEANDLDRAASIVGSPGPRLSWDVIHARAQILVRAGHPEEALALLSSRFDELPTDDPATVNSPGQLGALIRAGSLRAELELEHGSPESASAWARAIHILWEGGEGAVLPVTRRMREILDQSITR